MNPKMIIEMVGYLGSALVLVSFLMTSVFKLRVVNTVGSVIFAIYALIIHSYPTAIMNACLVAINIHFLWKMMHTTKAYEIVPVTPKDGYLMHFIQTHRVDIDKCFPGLKVDLNRADCAWFVNCEQKPVAILLGKENDGVLDIQLDYSTPEYRDFSVGTYLFEQLKSERIRKITYNGPTTDAHRVYLTKMGFQHVSDGYVKRLSGGKD